MPHHSGSAHDVVPSTAAGLAELPDEVEGELPLTSLVELLDDGVVARLAGVHLELAGR